MIFVSIFVDSKASYLIETKVLPIAFAKVLRISQLYLYGSTNTGPAWFFFSQTPFSIFAMPSKKILPKSMLSTWKLGLWTKEYNLASGPSMLHLNWEQLFWKSLRTQINFPFWLIYSLSYFSHQRRSNYKQKWKFKGNSYMRHVFEDLQKSSNPLFSQK